MALQNTCNWCVHTSESLGSSEPQCCDPFFERESVDQTENVILATIVSKVCWLKGIKFWDQDLEREPLSSIQPTLAFLRAMVNTISRNILGMHLRGSGCARNVPKSANTNN